MRWAGRRYQETNQARPLPSRLSPSAPLRVPHGRPQYPVRSRRFSGAGNQLVGTNVCRRGPRWCCMTRARHDAAAEEDEVEWQRSQGRSLTAAAASLEFAECACSLQGGVMAPLTALPAAVTQCSWRRKERPVSGATDRPRLVRRRGGGAGSQETAARRWPGAPGSRAPAPSSHH